MLGRRFWVWTLEEDVTGSQDSSCQTSTLPAQYARNETRFTIRPPNRGRRAPWAFEFRAAFLSLAGVSGRGFGGGYLKFVNVL